jgi:hypothetical protein
MNARITDRQDLKVAHEPSHRLVKVRTVVLERQLGRVHTAALGAFERVKTLCVKIAESHQPSVDEDKKGEVPGPVTRNQSNPEPTPKGTPTESGDGLPPDHAPDVPNDTTVQPMLEAVGILPKARGTRAHKMRNSLRTATHSHVTSVGVASRSRAGTVSIVKVSLEG